jgi:hypothetical protein
MVRYYGISKEKCARCVYTEFQEMLHVHHIDENKSNNDNSNLLIVCGNCHLSLHLGLWKLSDIGLTSEIAYMPYDGVKAKKERIAAGEDTWKPRGPDKNPRSTAGYFRRYQKPEGVRNE